MLLPTLFEVCTPRKDILAGSVTESDFAADLAQVLRGDAPEEYKDPRKFFAYTHPTRGLKDLLWNVCRRLSGSGGQAASILRLDTSYGGGKTHSLIALTHVARRAVGVSDVQEFLDPEAMPKVPVRIAAFDGENADPANGRRLGDGITAFTPWGEIAYALAGKDGFERVRRSDTQCVAPGAETFKELFGNQPTLILMDELSVYLRKLKALDRQQARGQLTAFMTGLFKAVESSPQAALVYTLAIGKGGRAVDAYSEENQFIADFMEEAESISARKAALLDPTEEGETVRVLRRRLFDTVDDEKSRAIIQAYREIWEAQKEHLPPIGAGDRRVEDFTAGFPLHPELIRTLKEKTSTLGNFQRVRGMLRLLAHTIARLWTQRPPDAYAIHPHHIDPTFEPIRQELVTRLGQSAFVPGLKADVGAVEEDQPSLAQEIDLQQYMGLPPYGSYVARTIFLHTLAFNEELKGVSQDGLRYSIVSPGTDISFVDDAVRRFVQASAYLDDRPNVPLRFLTEANLTQMVRRQEQQQVDPDEVRVQLKDRIKSIFSSRIFHLIPFPSMPNDIPDDPSEKKPILAVISYEAVDVNSDHPVLPELVRKLFREKGAGGDRRLGVNQVVFVVVDSHRCAEMKKKMIRRLALQQLNRPERLKELAEHQQDRLKEWHQKSESEVAISIQQAYRHVFYPSTHHVEGADVDLGYAVVELQNASADPGDGQKQLVRILRDVEKKLRLPADEPDSPEYLQAKTPLKKGQISTAALREEFRRDPALPILVGDDVFLKGIRKGIDEGRFVYRRGDLVLGKGDPWADIKIDEQSFVYTADYAGEHGIWPPPKAPPQEEQVQIPPPKSPEKTPPHTPPPETGKSFSEEGILKEALTRLWERTRKNNFIAVSALILKLYDADGFKLMGLVGTVPNSEKKIRIDGAYETNQGSELTIGFKGAIPDAQPVKDFLIPQWNAAKDKRIEVEFTIAFKEGLSLKGSEPENLTDRLCRFGTGAAYVKAVVEGDR